jgi:hypothetical protein
MMAGLIDDSLRQRLLASIAGNNLVVICGAGLSMAPPTCISSAARVAQNCAARYKDLTHYDLPNGIADNIENLAQHFFDRNELEHVLLKQLIDWSEFVRHRPNKGHTATADFLGARICVLAISANMDTCIESAATDLGEPDFYPLVCENDLNLSQSHSPLLKIHGCATRSRHESLWCKQQLEREPLKSRLPKLVSWMQHYLPNRDLLVIGFWSDWAYLNEVLEGAVVSTEPRSVIVVDPSPQDALQAKSPALWQWATERATFIHVQVSGDAFLDELRSVVSCHFVWKVWQKGRAVFEGLMGQKPPPDPMDSINALSTDELYRLRRDLTGVPSGSIVRQSDADDTHELIGLLHLALFLNGAHLRSNVFDWNGTTVRLVNTPNRLLSTVMQRHSNEPPDPDPPQRTICVGATEDGGAPANIIGRGQPGGIIRNAPANNWETHLELLSALQSGGVS